MTGGTLNNSSGSVYFRTVSAGLTLNSLAAATSSTITTGIDMTFGNIAVNTANGAAANDLVISGVISQNTGAGSGNKTVTKDGAGTLLLSGANTYAGGTTVNGGTLTGSSGVLFEGTQGGSFGTGAITVQTGATIRSSSNFVIGGGQNTTRTLNLTGGTANITGAGTGGEYIKTINMTAGTLIADNGTVYFRAPNGGGTTVNSLAAATPSTITTRVDLTFGNLAVSVADGAAAEDLVISGAITQNTGAGTGAKSVTKTGDGTLVLSGTSSYTGATTASAGTLLISGALGNTAVSVANDAVFGGTGTVGGNVSFDGNSFLQVVNIADALVIGGTVTFGSGFGIDNILGLDWDALTLNQSYTLLSTTTVFNDTLIENFGIDNKFAVGTDRYAYFQNGSLAVVVIPEPQAALLGGLGLLALLRRRRA
jgi:autotransporter-associated beta strand protein